MRFMLYVLECSKAHICDTHGQLSGRHDGKKSQSHKPRRWGWMEWMPENTHTNFSKHLIGKWHRSVSHFGWNKHWQICKSVIGQDLNSGSGGQEQIPVEPDHELPWGRVPGMTDFISLGLSWEHGRCSANVYGVNELYVKDELVSRDTWVHLGDAPGPMPAGGDALRLSTTHYSFPFFFNLFYRLSL
jgi:hypothetical protein